MPPITGAQLRELLHVEPQTADRVFTSLAGIEDAEAHSIVFAASQETLEAALAGCAGLILAPPACKHLGDTRLLCVPDPKYAFALLGRWLEASAVPAIHPSALIDPEATLGRHVSIGAGTVIQGGAILGDDCVVGSNAVIHAGVRLGRGCVVQSGAVLGSTGFGYVRGPEGRYIRFPQRGSLWIGDNVEIGANSTIDRGALGETRIGRGTKIDNLVHIAHNCNIGEDVIIAAQVGIAGSTTVGDGAILAGQVGLGEHVAIGPGVVIGAQGGVPTNKKLSGPGKTFWGTPARPIGEYLKDLATLRRRK